MGVRPDAVAALMARARREVDDGLLPACQVAIARHGRLAAFETFSGVAGAATDDSRFHLWSTTKGVMAGLVWQLVSEGLLAYDDTVARHIPEFATNGKEVVTVDHLMQHTTGFPRAPLGPREWGTSEGRRAAFARWQLRWPPGSRFWYSPFAAHWVLAELVNVVTGGDWRTELRTRVTGPLGLASLQLGVPVSEQHDIVDITTFGRRATQEEHDAAGIPKSVDPEPDIHSGQFMNDSRARAAGIPAAGAVATAADVALYYQALLHDPLGIWDPEVLADATGVIRNTFPDPNRGDIPVNRTRGIVVAGDDGNRYLRMNFGRTGSPRMFGHDGAGGQIAWADPATGVSFCYLTNGMDAHGVREFQRCEELASLAGSPTLIEP